MIYQRYTKRQGIPVKLQEAEMIACLQMPSRMRKQLIRSKRVKSDPKEERRALVKKRLNAGMDKRGFVKKNTPVVFKRVYNNVRLCMHPFFELSKIPAISFRYIKAEHFVELMNIELRLKEPTVNKKLMQNLVKHKYGANSGINLGKTLVSGGTHSEKPVFSGSIHDGPAHRVVGEELKLQIRDLVHRILEGSYGSTPWYKRVVHLNMLLNHQTKEERTIPGSIFSSIWLNIIPKKEAVHIDQNIVGPIFAFSTTRGKSLVVTSKGGMIYPIVQEAGVIVGGLWGSYPHCNIRICEEFFAGDRLSWVIYLDQRLFGKNYRYVRSKHEKISGKK